MILALPRGSRCARVVRLGAGITLALNVIGCAFHAQSTGAAAGRHVDPRGIERSLRPIGRIVGQPDTALALTERMKYWNVPGISIAIVDDFRIVYAKGFGVTEFGGSIPVDSATLFQAASISKPVFATGALRLVEQGRLELDEDVNTKLTSWRLPGSRFTEARPVTLRDLLTHTAGLSVSGFPGYRIGASIPSIQQVLDGASPANTPAVRSDTIPGTQWRYSGGGFVVAQLFVTDATGESLPDLMSRLVFDPAGMTQSTYANPPPAVNARRAATGHERIETPIPGGYHIYPELAAAGLWTTASDLARWAIGLSRAYNGDRTGPFTPELARRMIAPGIVATQGNGEMGLGVFASGSGDSISFSHGGRNEGFVATMEMWPTLGRGFIALSNAINRSFLNEIARGFGELYGVSAPRRFEHAIIDVSEEAIAPLAGRFVLSERDTFDISVRDNDLWFTMLSNRRSYRLWPIAPDTFYDVNSNGIVVFEREGKGPGARARVLRFGEGANGPRALRVP